MRILRYTLFLFAIGLISCEQEFDKKEGTLFGHPQVALLRTVRMLIADRLLFSKAYFLLTS